MEPLDLSCSPPRKAVSDEYGICFLARTIDKIRATLPGGNIGPYRIAADEVTTLSAHLFEHLGVTEDAFRAVVANAQSEDEVVAWVRQHLTDHSIDSWNRWVRSLTIANISDRGRQSLVRTNPSAAMLPASTPILDALDIEDDRV
jgi:hypothetical protein